MMTITIDQMIERSVSDDYMTGEDRAANIIKTGCKIAGIDEDELKSPCRKRPLSDLRAVVMFLIYENTRLSNEIIGGMFGRDHSTVVHSRRKVENRRFCPELNSLYEQIKNKVQ